MPSIARAPSPPAHLPIGTKTKLNSYVKISGASEDRLPHRRGSFRADWNDLLSYFAQRRKHEERRGNADKVEPEPAQPDDAGQRDLHEVLMERSNR
jgi:hypothetical protein